MRRLINIVILSLLPLLSFAQSAGSDDFFGNIGKIYVTVGVIMILFIGIIGFLIFLERRLAKLEDEFDN